MLRPPNKILTITPPDSCPGCGLEHKKAKEEGYDEGFLMFSIPNSGVAHYTCPKCFCVMMNVECFENQREIRKAQESRIIRPKKEALSLIAR